MVVNMETGRNGVPKLARALYTNTPEAKSELFFRKGDILSVIQFDYEGQKGWWLCTLLGEQGICPGNYLELLEHDYQNQQDEEDSIPAYDVPKSYQRPVTLNPVTKGQSPIYNSASLVRLKKHGSDGVSLGSTGSSNRVSSASSSAQSTSSSENSFPGAPLQSSRPESPIYVNESPLEHLERLRPTSPPPPSVQAELDYDIPRASLVTSSRLSATSMSGSRCGLSVANNSEVSSKDNLSELYDVPRSVKNCVSIFENKYDHVQHRPPTHHHRRDPSKRSSISSTTSSTTSSTNPQSSIEKQFELILRNAGSLRNADSIYNSRPASNNGNSSEAYDIVPPASQRNGSLQSWSASTSSNLDQSYYDMPAGSSRQVNSICGSTETLSCHDSFGTGRPEASSSSTGPVTMVTNHFESTGPAEVKILPLCPKAAVTICEKLRQEVITAINSILLQVKPKWRLKENLREIMPELRFACVRLNLGVKDFTDFCSRTVSNGKKFGLESLVIRLQKLLTPLTAGSQILQKDVDELEAYLWSVDRLSVTPNEKEVGGDALDQLVLCARSLQHDVTEIANFIALNSSPLFQDAGDLEDANKRVNSQVVGDELKCTVEDTQEDYDYVTLSSGGQTIKEPQQSSSSLDSRDKQILDFYSTQIGATGPLLSQSISTFISSVHQNDPPKAFNGHLKYVILLAYKMLFAGDTIHRNISNLEVKEQVEMKADELHKAVVALHEASKLATRDFPKITPMQNIIEHVWGTTSAAAQLKKVIFSATL